MAQVALTSDDIDLQQLAGLGPATKQKLQKAGIYNIMDLAVRGPHDLVDAGLDTDKARELLNAARSALTEKGLLEKDFVSAHDLYEKRLSIERIRTGCTGIDNLLGGGLETSAITEFFGEFSTGKSNICHQLAVMVQQPNSRGGLEGQAIYVDTEGTFRPERIKQIAESRGFDGDSCLDGITVARAYNSSHQELIGESLGRVIREKGAKLVVVDSAVAHYRAEFAGRGTLAERQQRLNRFMHNLLRTAELFNVVVVITNQVQSMPDMYFGDPTRATGGHVVAHTSTYRVYLRKSGKTRVARMVDSPCHAESEAVFVLGEGGVSDPSEK